MTDLINAFPGYEYKFIPGESRKQNMYLGTNLGFGGYVYFEEGMYENVALIDLASLHPSSILALNKFGKYTERYREIKDARIAIKHHELDKAKTMLDGKLAKFLTNEEDADQLAQALKLILNSTYGFCSANFENPFLDSRDTNNIVALRGSLFMRTLQEELRNMGVTVCHIKTDSMKIPNATSEIIQFCMDFAKKYSYEFEHEATYDRMCLVNGSTYIAKYASVEKCEQLYGYAPKENTKHPNEWTATAAQFQVPYVFKKLFSREPIEFSDLCETKEVKTALYLDMNESLPDTTQFEKERDKLWKDITNMNLPQDEEMQRKCDRVEELTKLIADCHDYKFVGKVGLFCPVKPGCGGGELMRMGKDKSGNTKYASATGAKGYRWLEAEMIREMGKEADIDRSYYDKLVDDAVEAISQYGDFEWFVSDDSESDIPEPDDHPTEFDVPWKTSCGKDTCFGCPNLKELGQGDFYECTKGYDISDLIAYAQSLYEDDGDLFNKR